MRKDGHAKYLMIVPLVVALALLLMCVWYNRQEEIRAEAQICRVSMDSSTEQIATLNAALDGRFTTLEAYARGMGTHDHFLFDDPETRALLGAVRDGSYEFDMYVADKNGVCHASDGSVYYVADRRYFAESISGSRAIECLSDSRQTGESCILLSVPIIRQGEVIGAVLGAFDERAFRNMLITEVYDRKGYSFICDMAGNIVIGSSHTLFVPVNNIFDIINDNTIVKDDDEKKLGANLRSGFSGYTMYTDADGAKRLAVYKPTGTNDWVIFNVTPGSVIAEAMREAIGASYAMTVTVAALVFVMLLLMYFILHRGARSLEQERVDFRAAALQSGHMLRIYNLKDNRLINSYNENSVSWKATPAEMVESGIVAPESRDEYLRFYENMRNGVPSGSANARIKDAAGVFRWYHADYSLVNDQRGRPDHAVVTIFDNSEQMLGEQAFARWKEAANALSQRSAIYIEVNLTRNVVEELLGKPYITKDGTESTLDEYVQHGVTHFIYSDDAAQYQEFMRRERLLLLYYSGTHDDSIEIRRAPFGAETQPRWFRVTASMVDMPDSHDIRLLTTYIDIDLEKREQQRLLQLARRDYMTGLLNRETLHESIRSILASVAPDTLVSMLIIDLDNFKAVNDTYGHQRGDEVIRESGRAIASVFRAGDLVGRIGGDEFMAFLTDVPPALIERRAAEICAACQLAVGDVSLSSSVGGCVMAAGDARYSTMYRISDAALYRAKSERKGGYFIDASGSPAGKPDEKHVTLENANTIQLQALMNYMDAGVMLAEIGPEIRALYISPGFFNVMKRDRDKTSNVAVLSFIHADDKEGLYAAARSAAENGAMLDRTYRVYCPDGTIGWRHMRAVRIPYQASAYPVLIAVVTDITEMKKQEREIRLSQRVYQEAMSHTNTYVWEIDVKQRRLTMSAKLIEYHAHGRNIDALGRDETFTLESLMDTGLYYPEDAPRLAEMEAAIEGGKPEYSIVLREKARDGSAQWARYRYSMIFGDDGEPLHAIGTIEPLPNINAVMILLEQEKRLQDAIAGSIMGYGRFNISKNRVEAFYASDVNAEEHPDGMTYDELFDMGETDLYAESDRRTRREKQSLQALVSAFARGESWVFSEYRRRDEDGRIKWVSTVLHMLRDPVSGDVYGFAYIQDIDKRKRWEMALPQKPERELLGYLYTAQTMRKLADNVILGRRNAPGQCGMILFELRGLDILREREGVQAASDVLLFYSRVLRALSGEDKIAGRGDKGGFIVFAFDIESAQSFAEYTKALCARMAEVRNRVVGNDGIELIVGVSAAENSSASFDTLYREARIAFGTSMQNVTLYQNAATPAPDDEPAADGTAVVRYVDELTGVLNRSAYYDMLLHNSADALSSLGAILTDVNQLSVINRSRGVGYGDELIRFVAATMREIFPQDMVFRMSGDELLVLVKNSVHADFTAGSERFSQKLNAAYPGMVSVGSTWEEHNIDMAKLYGRVETMLRLDKQQNAEKNNIDKAQHTLHARATLRRRIDEGQFSIYLQPKARISDGQITGAEVLVRLDDPEDGLLQPSRFIPFYEGEGVISQLDLHVFELALKQLASWRAQNRIPLPLAVNFSRLTLLMPHLCDTLRSLLSQYSIPAELIEIEITENAGNIGRAAIQTACDTLRSLGLHLSLDDFGSEYSSLYVLSAIHFDTIKIDKTVVDEIYTNPLSQLNVRHIVDLCAQTSSSCIAEGVETEQQYSTLRTLNCTFAQGYYINKPLPAQEFERLYM